MKSLIKIAVYAVVLSIVLILLKKYYFSGGWCHSKARIDGKVVIVTGANTGIGKETALDLVNRGGKVYLACRSLQRCNTAADYIKQKAAVNDSSVPVLRLDLASFASIRTFVEEFTSKEKRLDILVNNAGVYMNSESSVTEDGLETIMGVNHLGHFLLTNLLMDQLFAAKLSRVVTVSSNFHYFFDINFDEFLLQREGPVGKIKSYCISKLANVLFTMELGRRLKGFGVTSYSLHPGTVETEIHRNAPIVGSYLGQLLLWSLIKPFSKTAVEGSQTSICCAVDEKLAEETGKYYSDCVEKVSSSSATDEQAKRLWELSVELVNLKTEEIHPLLR